MIEDNELLNCLDYAIKNPLVYQAIMKHRPDARPNRNKVPEFVVN